MDVAHDKPAAPPRGRRIDRSLALLIGGALALIVAGLISVPLTSRRAPSLAPATTPEGVVQRFYQAVYSGDYAGAHGFLSTETRGKLSVGALQEQLSYDARDSYVRTSTTTINGSNATVQVVVTRFSSGGLFGSSEYSSDREVFLEREGDSWKIASGPFSGPFYVPD